MKKMKKRMKKHTKKKRMEKPEQQHITLPRKARSDPFAYFSKHGKTAIHLCLEGNGERHCESYQLIHKWIDKKHTDEKYRNKKSRLRRSNSSIENLSLARSGFKQRSAWR